VIYLLSFLNFYSLSAGFFSSFVKQRNNTVWASCLMESINQQIETSSCILPRCLLLPDWNQEPIIPVTVIQTLYDPSLKQNMTFPGPKGSDEKIFQFTETQRQFASKAKVPNNLEELKDMVRMF
jgi:hypothetical protein